MACDNLKPTYAHVEKGGFARCRRPVFLSVSAQIWPATRSDIRTAHNTARRLLRWPRSSGIYRLSHRGDIYLFV